MRFSLIALVALAAAMYVVSPAQAQVVTVLRPATTVYMPTFNNPVVMPSTPSAVYSPVLTSSTVTALRPVTTYYAPTTTAYYAPTTTTYYSPSTTTTTYYAPSQAVTTTLMPVTSTTVVPTTTYMVPSSTTYVFPGRRIGLLRPIVVRQMPTVIVTP